MVSVTVLEKGFEFEGRTYRSLSAIAAEQKDEVDPVEPPVPAAT